MYIPILGRNWYFFVIAKGIPLLDISSSWQRIYLSMTQMTPCMHLVFVGDLRRYVIAVKVSMDTFLHRQPKLTWVLAPSLCDKITSFYVRSFRVWTHCSSGAILIVHTRYYKVNKLIILKCGQSILKVCLANSLKHRYPIFMWGCTWESLPCYKIAMRYENKNIFQASKNVYKISYLHSVWLAFCVVVDCFAVRVWIYRFPIQQNFAFFSLSSMAALSSTERKNAEAITIWQNRGHLIKKTWNVQSPAEVI